MSRLASILYLVGYIAAANAASSVPIATQPLLTTATISVAANALSTSFSTFTSTETVVLYSTFTSRQRVVTSSVGQQLSVIISTSAVLASGSSAELSTVVNTIGSTTLYSVESSKSSTLPTSTSSKISTSDTSSTSILPPAVVPTTSAQTSQTTPINLVTSTASLSSYSTSLASASSTFDASIPSSQATSQKSSKKLSSSTAAGIAVALAIVIGILVGVFVSFLSKRRHSKKWGRNGMADSQGSESKTNLFSPDARAGYDSMWKKPVVATALVSEKEYRSEDGATTAERESPVSHHRGDSSTLGIDAPSIAPTTSGANSPKSEELEDKPKLHSPGAWRTVPNFSAPIRRSVSITALPTVGVRHGLGSERGTL